MSRSNWNDVDHKSNGEIKGGGYMDKHYPKKSLPSSPSSLSNSSSYSYTTVSSNNADGAAITTSKTPQSTESMSGSSSPSLTATSSSVLSRSSFLSSSETLYIDKTETSTTNSSFYETLQAEAASCCPLCGFQILAATSLSPNIDAGSEFRTMALASVAGATPYPKNNSVQSNTHDDPTRSFWLRSFVVNEQENLLNGCNHVESSGLLATTTKNTAAVTMGRQVGSKQSMFPTGTCWICLQAATTAAKERQVEDDRRLAASLSAIILEQQEDRCTEIHTPAPHNIETNDDDENYNMNAILTSHGDHQCEIASIGDYGPRLGTTNWIPNYRDQGLPRQEQIEERNGPSPVSMSASQAQRFEKDEMKGQKCSQSSTTFYKRNIPMNQDCNIDYDKKNVIVNVDTCVYIGEYNISVQPHGSHGEMIWESGDRYVGTFKNGMRSGQGVFFFRDGSEYAGDWKENLMHGFGQRKFANGDSYVGQYHKGQRSGGPKLKYKFANGDLYVGDWDADRFHGFGRYFYADGSVLEGNFVHSAKQGKFKRQLPTEDLDILRFEDDQIVGQGVRWNKKRTKTWLLELSIIHSHDSATTRNAPSNALKARKKNCRRTARRMVRGIGNLARRSGLRKSVNNLPSSVGASDDITARNAEGHEINNTSSNSSASLLTSSPSSALPLDNLLPVIPQESTKHIVKKSVRIPISQAVSIGYDCEIGTGARVGPVSVK